MIYDKEKRKRFLRWCFASGICTRETPLKQTLNRIKKEIKNLPHEKLYIIDKNGKIIASRTGKKNNVFLKGLEKKLQKAHTVIHNHPSGGSFSMADLRVAFNFKIKNMRVTSSEYDYNFQFNFKEVEKQIGGKDFYPLSAIYEYIDGINYKKYYPKYKSGELSEIEAIKKHYHENILFFAKKTQSNYTRVKNG